MKCSNIAAAAAGTAYVTVCGKGGNARTVRVKEATPALLLVNRTKAAAVDYVFAGRDGALDPSQALPIVRNIEQRVGIEKNVSPHFMRHSHATHAIDRGVKITTARDILGHSLIAITDRYAPCRPDESSGLSLAF